MTKIRKQELLSLLCIIQMFTSARGHVHNENYLSRSVLNANSSDIEEKFIQSLRISIQSYQKVIDAINLVEEDANSVDYEPVCKILDLEEFANFTNTRYPRWIDLDFPHRSILHVKFVECPYARMKETDEDYENDLELNYYRYNLFEEVRRKYADAPIRQRVEAARKMCQIMQYPELIADITKSTKELTEQQLAKFAALVSTTKTENSRKRADAFNSICNLLNETVDPKEQASALQIPLDLYKKFADIRKSGGSFSSLCSRINKKEGVHPGQSSPRVFIYDFEYTRKLEIYTALNEATIAENSKKTMHWRNLCVNLNLSLPYEKLAELAGVSLEVYQEMDLIEKNHLDDRFPQIALTIELCHMVTPNDMRLMNLTENNVNFTDKQLKKFEEKLITLNDDRTSIQHRVELLRNLCTWMTGSRELESSGTNGTHESNILIVISAFFLHIFVQFLCNFFTIFK